MDEARIKARYDWLAELGGAVALGLAAGFAALKLSPSFALAPAAAMTASGVAAFGMGLLAMRAVKPEPRGFALAGLGEGPAAHGELALNSIVQEPLLLEERYEDPELLEEIACQVAEDGVLLFDDPLVADPDSRVVHLFAALPMPTPSQIKGRIDRHRANGATQAVPVQQGPGPDASDALYAALAELRRSLR